MKSSPAPRPTTEEARTANRLADAILVVAGDYAREHQLSPGCVFAALTLALGRLVGGTAREESAVLNHLIRAVKKHVERVARREFKRERWLQ